MHLHLHVYSGLDQSMRIQFWQRFWQDVPGALRLFVYNWCWIETASVRRESDGTKSCILGGAISKSLGAPISLIDNSNILRVLHLQLRQRLILLAHMLVHNLPMCCQLYPSDVYLFTK